MKKLSIVTATILALGVIYLLFLYFVRPTPTDLGLAPFPEKVHREADVTIRWFGVSTLLIEDEKTSIMIDGFISRPSLLDLLLDRPVAPDINVIQNTLNQLHIKDLDAITTVHSHYDHAMDTGVVALLTGAQVLGSASTVNVAKGAGVPASKITEVSLDEQYQFGQFTLQFYPSNHAPIQEGGPPMPGVIDSPLTPPQHISAWREGGSYSIVIRHPQTSLLIQGSAGFEPNALQGVKVENVFLGAGGLSRFERAYVKQYIHETVTQTQANQVFLIHHDDFFTAAFGKIKLMPSIVMDELFIFELQQWLLPATLFSLEFNQTVPLGRVETEQLETKAVWIDVRSSIEHALDAIEGDIHITHTDILENVSKRFPDKTTNLKLYCGGGGRAESALDVLQSAGYTNVSNMGGIEDARRTRGLE